MRRLLGLATVLLVLAGVLAAVTWDDAGDEPARMPLDDDHGAPVTRRRTDPGPPVTERSPEVALRTALLTARDLPDGFEPDPSLVEDDGGDGPSLCADVDPIEELRPADEVSAGFAAGTQGPFVLQMAARYRDGDAEEVLDRAREAVARCPRFTEVDDGERVTWTARRLGFPDLADETFAAHLTAQSTPSPVEVDLVFLRKDEVVVLLAHFGGDRVDATLTRSLARRVEAKLD